MGLEKAILFPIETNARELDYRLALAVASLEPGQTVYLGNHTDIFNLGQRLNDALYVGKHLFNLNPSAVTERYERLHALGHRVICIQEEGAVFGGEARSWEEALKQKFDPGWMHGGDVLCVWGTAQEAIYREMAHDAELKILPAGHPRFNLCARRFDPLYEGECRSLADRFGPVILINTNYTMANAMQGWDWSFVRDPETRTDPKRRVKAASGFAAHLARIGETIKLATRLQQAFPDHRLILRPHPSEEIAIYEAFVPHIPGLSVVREGSLMAWLRHADAIIHTDCTTAIEASLCGRPLIRYLPNPDPETDCRLPAGLGWPCETPDEVVDALARIIHNKEIFQPSSTPEGAVACLRNFDPSFDSLDFHTNLIRKEAADRPETRWRAGIAPFRRRGWMEQIKRSVREPLGWERQPGRRTRHARAKFRGLDPSEINPKIRILEKIFSRRIQCRYFSSVLISLQTAP